MKVPVINSIISLKWLCQTISCVCSKNDGDGHKFSQQLQVCKSGLLRCCQTVARDSYKWFSY